MVELSRTQCVDLGLVTVIDCWFTARCDLGS